MAKKSFKNNPALQFITVQEEAPAIETPAAETIVAPAEKSPGKPRAAMPENRPSPKMDTVDPATGAGGFLISAIEQVKASGAIPPPEQGDASAVPEQSAPDKAPVPMKLNPMYIETRSKRVQLLMQPSLHTRLREMAATRGQSLNDLVHEALEQFAE